MTLPPPDPRENDLLDQAAKGDLKAFAGLIRQYEGLVYRFLFHYLGNHSDAEELAQETFVLVFRKLPQHQRGHSFSAWLMTIAKNLALSHHRHKAPTPMEPAVLAEAVNGTFPAPEEELLVREAGQEVHLALQKLPDIHREVLIMHYLLDVPVQELAVMLNIPEGTAKSRLFKGRQEIKEILARISS